ncbi:MAG: hypothetical protein RLZZ136_310 [Pseudomonadota bacterium]
MLRIGPYPTAMRHHVLAGLLLLAPNMAWAQQPSPTAEAKPLGPLNLMITAQRRSARCGAASNGGEIVVCGSDHGEDIRVPSTSDSDRASHDALNTGVPHAPNVSGLPDCSRGCIGMGNAPPIIYVIDVKALPEAPKGSDAEKVANGEISDR